MDFHLTYLTDAYWDRDEGFRFGVRSQFEVTVNKICRENHFGA